ncbi:MAG: hypothetical protein ACI9F9_000271 [Candidatus Paceibacteria bacterium]|jgi:hypothetical protein
MQSSIQFRDEAAKRGVHFMHHPNRSSARLMPEVLGAGVAVADFDRNGAPDLYFVGGGDLSQDVRPAKSYDRLYLNDGTGNFRDASEDWGISGTGFGMGVACGDYDNDGWVDLLLTTFADGERLLRNTGGAFEDVTVAAQLESKDRWGTSAGFFDCDGDGDLDVYVACYVDYDLRAALPCWHNERQVYCSPALFDAAPDKLLINNGDGTFSDKSAAVDVQGFRGKGLALVLGDVDWDGDVDAYVANDITRNLLLMNDGAGGFEDRGRIAGVAYDETGRAAAGMGADLSDVDGNGLLDISCTNFQEETSNIYLQKPEGVFRDRSYALGVGSSGHQRLSFGVDFCDLDNDGDEDLFIANGHIDDGIGSVSAKVTFAQQNSVYRLGDDGRFSDLSDASGKSMQAAEVSRGAVSADLDGDGVLDLVVTNNAGPARLLMNASPLDGQGSVVLWLEGVKSNRSAIGTRVEVQLPDGVMRREVRGASSYLSQCDSRIHVGIGAAAASGAITLLWPSGERQEIGELAAGFYRVVEGAGPAPFVPGAALIPPG